jgi:hypothetical protein
MSVPWTSFSNFCPLAIFSQDAAAEWEQCNLANRALLAGRFEWLRRRPVLSFVIPEYVILLKGWDHHTAALKESQRATPMAQSGRSSPTSAKPRTILPVLQIQRGN